MSNFTFLKTDRSELYETAREAESAVSQASRRFAQVLERDKDLLKQIEKSMDSPVLDGRGAGGGCTGRYLTISRHDRS